LLKSPQVRTPISSAQPGVSRTSRREHETAGSLANGTTQEIACASKSIIDWLVLATMLLSFPVLSQARRAQCHPSPDFAAGITAMRAGVPPIAFGRVHAARDASVRACVVASSGGPCSCQISIRPPQALFRASTCSSWQTTTLPRAPRPIDFVLDTGHGPGDPAETTTAGRWHAGAVCLVFPRWQGRSGGCLLAHGSSRGIWVGPSEALFKRADPSLIFGRRGHPRSAIDSLDRSTMRPESGASQSFV
jgi:hypothetical protein